MRVDHETAAHPARTTPPSVWEGRDGHPLLRSVSSRPGYEPFRVEVHPERDAVRVTPVGELDIATTGQVEDRLRELHTSGFRRFVLDLRELEFMDSNGLHLVLDWSARASEDGIGFAFVEGPPAVQRVLEVSGVLDQLSPRRRQGSPGLQCSTPDRAGRFPGGPGGSHAVL